MTTIRSPLYARISGEQQAAAHTIESQITALSDHARIDGTPVPPERQFVDDGYSGATLVRPTPVRSLAKEIEERLPLAKVYRDLPRGG